MSTYIVDRAVAVMIPKSVINAPDATWQMDDQWLLLEEGGDSNCFNIRTGARARNWCCVATGLDWQVMATVVQNAASCCGGCLRRNGESNTEPEQYIRWWRNAMKNAVALSDLYKIGLHVDLRLKFDAEDAKAAYIIGDCKAELGREPEIADYYGTKQLAWEINRDSFTEMQVWAKAHVAHPWYKCGVTARGNSQELDLSA